MSNDYFVFEDENEMDEEDYFEGEDFEGYAGNMPCDTYGLCGDTSCPNFWKCHGKQKLRLRFWESFS